MAKKTPQPKPEGFQNKALSGLSALREGLPGAEREAPTATPEQTPRAASELRGKLVLRRERKQRGGKTVTCLEGLSVEPHAMQALAKRMAKALGCGASVEQGAILLQGDQVERAQSWLERGGAQHVVRGN